MSGIRGFLDFLGNMGLFARGDRPKVIDLTGREFGEERAGLSLSVRQVAKQDSDELPSLSVVIRNNGPKALAFVTPGWLAFYPTEVIGPDGAPVPLSPYGSQLLQAGQGAETAVVSLPTAGLNETILPIGSLYSMRGGREYTVSVSCQLPDKTELKSNATVVKL